LCQVVAFLISNMELFRNSRPFPALGFVGFPRVGHHGFPEPPPTVCRRSRKPRVTKAFINHWFINIAKLNYVKSFKHPRETYKNLAHKTVANPCITDRSELWPHITESGLS
ncbi:MAG: hypothetical protein QXZ22_06705, partial [Sulfolobales archaeon]